MDRKAQDAAAAFVAGRVGRRELIQRLGALGLTAAAADMLVNATATRALAQGHDWKAQQGQSVKLLLNKHPYADAMIANIDAFKSLTGMNVAYDIFPEDVYFDKVTAALSSRSSEYDAFMTGAYQTWQYGPAGWLVDLSAYVNDPAKTAPGYNWDDVLPNLRSSTAWSGKPGDTLGGPGAKQWAVPWGWEMNNLSYNQPMLDKLGIHPPRNMHELMEAAAKVGRDAGGPYGIGVRGSRSWATIHPGYLSGYTNYGAKDFTVEGGKLRSAVNSPESKRFTADFVKMVQDSGPKNWATYTWYQVGADLGAGASAMIYDADNLFVATFLGEPPMNALPGEATTDGVRLEAGGLPLRVAGALPPPGTPVVLGVRPHHIRLGAGEWTGSVISNRWLGDQAHVALDVAGATVVAVAHERVPAAVGVSVPLSVAPGGIHLFDRESGRALLHGA